RRSTSVFLINRELRGTAYGIPAEIGSTVKLVAAIVHNKLTDIDSRRLSHLAHVNAGLTENLLRGATLQGIGKSSRIVYLKFFLILLVILGDKIRIGIDDFHLILGVVRRVIRHHIPQFFTRTGIHRQR